jgi:hypothetical protein
MSTWVRISDFWAAGALYIWPAGKAGWKSVNLRDVHSFPVFYYAKLAHQLDSLEDIMQFLVIPQNCMISG